MDQATDFNMRVDVAGARFPRTTFFALFLPIAALVLVVGLALAAQRTDAHINSLLAGDSARLNLVSGFVGAGVLSSLRHLSSLSIEPVTRRALASRTPENMRALEASFLTLARRNREYQQIRWIDETGREIVRIMRNGSAPYAVPREELQDKRGRYYFRHASSLLPGELYISRADLNEEHGEVEIPHRPVIRIATPLVDAEKNSRGIVIINIEMTHLFNLVHISDGSRPEAEFILVNQEGVILNGNTGVLRDTAGRESGFVLPNRELLQMLRESNSGSLELDDGLWTWKTLSPESTFNRLARIFPEQLVEFDQLNADDFSLTLVTHRPLSVLMDVRKDNRLLISMVLVFSLAVYGVSLFFYLNGRARARNAEMDAAFAMARASSLKRMKELEERFHHLVDASSVGQLVVDGRGTIEISNPAAERVLGYDRGELDGIKVETLLPGDRREAHKRYRDSFMKSPQSRMMGAGRELEALRKDGSCVPVEVGLTPYHENGRQLVLVSLIDLSHRQGM